ncbi:hypothetical protein [Gemmobacter serpentinus]|uniref:hypothetical protein n=1 Tax=Gemmobacter serpentinus TaxID=2652247 RepID=UPI00124E4212|nr:hypothetical protein [Gemmobacter serpentinus]
MDLARMVQQIGNMLFRRVARRMMHQQMQKMSGPARTPEEKAQAQKGKEMQRRANQTARFLRRLGR